MPTETEIHAALYELVTRLRIPQTLGQFYLGVEVDRANGNYPPQAVIVLDRSQAALSEEMQALLPKEVKVNNARIPIVCSSIRNICVKAELN